jgi:HEAT repeat protein
MSALKALEALADETRIPGIVQFINTTASEDERTAAFAAMRSIGARVREKALDAVLAGLSQSGDTNKPSYFEILATIGGARGVVPVAQAATVGTSSGIQTAAVRALSEWSTLDAAPQLLTLAQSSGTNALRSIAFRGYIRLGRESEIAEPNKVKYFSDAVDKVRAVDEKQLLLGALGELGSSEALQLANRFVPDESVAQEAGFACVGIISKFDAQKKAEAAPILKSIAHSAKNTSLQESVRQQMKRLGIAE